jgi:sugar/nucleoside kinase (ribokinase family)
MAVLGSVAFDQLEREGRTEYRLGGVGTYAGLTAWKLGWTVRLMAHVPEADWPQLRALDLMGPNCWLPSVHRTVFINRELVEGGREQALLSRSDALQPASLQAWLNPSAPLDWIHLGPLFPDDFGLGLVKTARSLTGVLSADLQGWVRGVGQNQQVIPAWNPETADDWQHLDWVKASKDEWDIVERHTGHSPERALKQFGWKGLLITAGAKGGRLFWAGGELAWQGVPPHNITQETGAGDVYMAGFMAEILATGLGACMNTEPLSALELGSALQLALDRAALLASRHISGDWLDADQLRLTHFA